MMLWHTENTQAFAFLPKAEQRRQAVGAAYRWRRHGLWRHYVVSAAWPRSDLRWGRGLGVLTLEACTWLSTRAQNTKRENGRVARSKQFVRVKIGLGGGW